MSNNIKNVAKSVSNILSAATSIVAVSTEVLADSTGMVSNSVSSTPKVMKALLVTPFSAAKGYLMEAEGLSSEEAELVAFHYIKQDVATTIAEAGEGAGKLVATMFEDDEEENIVIEDKANKEAA